MERYFYGNFSRFFPRTKYVEKYIELRWSRAGFPVSLVSSLKKIFPYLAFRQLAKLKFRMTIQNLLYFLANSKVKVLEFTL